MKVLYVDDIRFPEKWHKNGDEITVCRTYDEAIYQLDNNYDIIDLDNDLGENKEGYDIAKYIVENNIKISNIYIHTMNPVARNNMVQLFQRYGFKNIVIYF